MDGLIIKRKWIRMILDGKKAIEVRGCSTKKINEPIYLLESGSHRVLATCRIETTYPMSCSDWSTERENHCVDISYAEIKKKYKNPTAWVLADIKPIKDVLYYDHPAGAVIWVKNVVPYELLE